MRLGVIDFSEKHANIGTLFWATVSEKDKLTKEKKFWVRKKDATSKALAETHRNRQDGVANPVERLMNGILKAKKGKLRPSVVRIIEPV